MHAGSAGLPVFGLLLFQFFCSPSFAVEYDAVTSDPPAAKETPPPVEAPFFGDQPDVRKDEPGDDAVPFFGKPVAVEEEPAVKRRESGKLEIPADAADRNDLSFLEGCWYFAKAEYFADTPTRDSLGIAQDSYCFNKNGKGNKYTQYFKFNRRFSAKATARFDKNGDIVFDNQGNMNMLKTVVRCKGRNTGTQCFMHVPNIKYLPKDVIVTLSRTP